MLLGICRSLTGIISTALKGLNELGPRWVPFPPAAKLGRFGEMHNPIPSSLMLLERESPS